MPALRLRDVQNGAYLDAAIHQDVIPQSTGRICVIHEDRDYQFRLYGLLPNTRYILSWSYYRGSTLGYCGEGILTSSYYPIAEFTSTNNGLWFSEIDNITWRWDPCYTFGICSPIDYTSYMTICFKLSEIGAGWLFQLEFTPEMFTFLLPNLKEFCTTITCTPIGCICVKAIKGPFPWLSPTQITPDKPCLY